MSVPGREPNPIVEPRFIAGPRGPLFTLYYAPVFAPGEPTAAEMPGLLFLPPFAEEMNRSRRMTALLGRALAARGVATLILDLFGTGDSAGTFEQARWDIWREDAAAALAWLGRRAPGGLTLLGLRLGACLAFELAQGGQVQGGQTPARVVLWNPVVRGDLMLNQFLRVRALAGIGQGGIGQGGPGPTPGPAPAPESAPESAPEPAGGESTKALRARLRAGETLEIAGYALHPELAEALDALRLTQLGQTCPAPVEWLEVAPEADAPPPPAAAKAIEALRAAGVDIAYASVAGEPFWTIEETVVSAPLIARTAAPWPA